MKCEVGEMREECLVETSSKDTGDAMPRVAVAVSAGAGGSLAEALT